MGKHNDRIKAVRNELGLSQRDFAKLMGVSRGVISNLDGNLTDASEEFLGLLCRLFNVNRNWLETGDGEMFDTDQIRKKNIKQFVDGMSDETAESEFKLAFLESLSEMTPGQWRMLMDFIKQLSDKAAAKQESEGDPEREKIVYEMIARSTDSDGKLRKRVRDVNIDSIPTVTDDDDDL